MKYLLPLILVGCATELTPDEREYRDNENAAKWELCKEIYKAHGKPTISYHDHGPHKTHKAWEVRDDLMHNQCHRLLRGVWD